MSNARRIGLLFIISTSYACVDDGGDTRADRRGCEGKCDDAEADDPQEEDAEEEGSVCPNEPGSLGCCWVAPDDSGAEALLCSLNTETIAPAAAELRLNRYDAGGLLEAREVINADGTTTRAWAVERYPFTLEMELVLSSDTVIGLSQGISTIERLDVTSADALTEEAPLPLKSPVEVWQAEIHNRYEDELAMLGFEYTLELGDEPLSVRAEDVVAEYGVRDTVAVAVLPGTESLPVVVDLRTVGTPNTPGTRVETTLTGTGAYTLDPSGLTAVTLEEPVGDAVTQCAIERESIPAPDDCEPRTCPEDDATCVPEDCSLTISDTLVCTTPPLPELGAVRVTAQGGGVPESAPTTLTLTEESTRLPLDPAGYPYAVEIEVEFTSALVGLEDLVDDERLQRSVVTFTDESSTGAFHLPFEVWEVTVTSPDYGIIYPESWSIELGYTRPDRFALRTSNVGFEAYEGAETMLVPVAAGTTALRSRLEWYSATDPDGFVELDVSLEAGAWVVTQDGLVAAE